MNHPTVDQCKTVVDKLRRLGDDYDRDAFRHAMQFVIGTNMRDQQAACRNESASVAYYEAASMVEALYEPTGKENGDEWASARVQSDKRDV